MLKQTAEKNVPKRSFWNCMVPPQTLAFVGQQRSSEMSEPRRAGVVRDMELVTPSGGRT